MFINFNIITRTNITQLIEELHDSHCVYTCPTGEEPPYNNTDYNFKIPGNLVLNRRGFFEKFCLFFF
jgi:hypothetical protein